MRIGYYWGHGRHKIKKTLILWVRFTEYYVGQENSFTHRETLTFWGWTNRIKDTPKECIEENIKILNLLHERGAIDWFYESLLNDTKKQIDRFGLGNDFSLTHLFDVIN